MDNFSIEEKDAQLLLKVKGRQSLSRRHRHMWRIRPTVLVLCLMVLLIYSGYLFYPSMAFNDNGQWVSTPENSDGNEKTPDKLYQEPISETATATIPVCRSGDAVKTGTFSSEPPSIPSNRTDPAQISRPVAAGSRISEPLAQSSANSLKITRTVVCNAIRDHQFIGEKHTFSIKKDRKACVWMEVNSKNIPRTLTHIYYRNGTKYCDVPLAVRYSRTRTWSCITLRRPDYTGFWSVEITDETGRVLNRVEFEVIP
ncbi:MAG: DUF2914 domain-containing protein [Desulfobacterales bacterium]|nr:DUF2914 domain-containing protein [Desulfobacterales bacterium]MDD4071737.1 DUF2914 domain-containing protein [Desulfobacterales bacterium]MDD4391698.1 DUF2914 domain-containing protein [Desulfobacterales bacterium]